MQSVNTVPDADLQGLRVKLRPCRCCGCITGHITKNTVICDSCGRKRHRLDQTTQRFLRDFVSVFGRPTSPIEIREPSLLPSGAGAETEINAPNGESHHGK